MYQGKKILGLITARGGSKGIPRKNVIDVGGKPLIAWTIEAAKESKLLDRVVLSSDDDEIIQVARLLGCEVPFKRDSWLSGDAASSADVVADCLQRIPGYDYIVLLQPTSPLRSTEDIDSAIKTCIDKKAPACVSVCESEESPYWMYTLQGGGVMVPVINNGYLRRQELPPVYVLNGALYVADVQWFARARGFMSSGTVAYCMPRCRSIDIDVIGDLERVDTELNKSTWR
ncbi:cytidylyltransferase domain-containing protein [Pseudomonas sp. URMO17WK12:I4]|uniref:acylneuraminate cytidylyltransferase family protein n=1 Tax=Pseudomonas sp. URMO17WK12:I4 TaxID=1283292 RepID=UPI0009DCCA45|nr:acylneuraminate cytidylyltransferase family protein [Pseudomonas sp. URMO17WK12:I4]